MITRDEYLRGYDETYKDEFTEQLSDNTDALLIAVNEFLKDFKGTIIVNSGFRPKARNNMIPHASKTSKHLECLAIDLNDPKGELWQYILQNMEAAKKLNLFFEHPNWTRTKTGGWCHIQLGGPASGKRVFIPSTSPAIDPNFWLGKIDSKYDVKAKK